MAAGQTITVFRPKIWFSKNWGAAVLPLKNLAVGADWNTLPNGAGLGTDWTLIDNTANGAQFTFVNPKQDITTDEHGIIDVIASGADTINVTLQSRTPFPDLIQKAGGMIKNTETAATDVRTLTTTAGVGTNGNALVTLNGTVYTVAVTTASEGTTAGLATRLRNSANYSPALTGFTLTGAGNDIIYTSTATNQFISGAFSYNANGTGSTATFALTTVGQPAMDRYNLNPDADNYFMLGMEGTFQANSLKSLAGRARIIAYKVQQTENPQMHWRTRGNDSLLQPVLTARCLNSVVASSQLTSTGYTASTVDALGRLDWWIV